MTFVKVYSSNRRVSVDVELAHVSDEQCRLIQKELVDKLATEPAYSAIAQAYIFALELCPKANPSDIWHHIIYRTYLDTGRNEQSWVRASGQGFEEAFKDWYNPRLIQYGIRLVVLTQGTAVRALEEMRLSGRIAPSKMDIAIEGNCSSDIPSWKIFGIVHGKTSFAERVKDDAPASRIIMDAGYFSVLVTLDTKSFPPPHGNGINYGELGGRTAGKDTRQEQQKRNYIEIDGDFNNAYSYNLRTPPSSGHPPSGCKIKTLPFSDPQPDMFVADVVEFWKNNMEKLCRTTPETSVLI